MEISPNLLMDHLRLGMMVTDCSRCSRCSTGPVTDAAVPGMICSGERWQPAGLTARTSKSWSRKRINIQTFNERNETTREGGGFFSGAISIFNRKFRIRLDPQSGPDSWWLLKGSCRMQTLAIGSNYLPRGMVTLSDERRDIFLRSSGVRTGPGL